MSLKLPRLTSNAAIVGTDTGKALLYFTRLWDTFATAIEARLTAIGLIGIVVSDGTGQAKTVSISAGTGIAVTNANGVAGNPSVALTDTAVTTGTYGDATHVGAVTVDQQGRITSASSAAIAFPVTSVLGRTGDVVAASDDYTLTQIGAPTANFAMAGHKLTGLAAATATGDALSYGNAGNLSSLDVTGNVAFGTHTATGSTSPLTLDLGASYSSVAGANPKLLLYNDGTNKYGLGVSSGLLYFFSPNSSPIAFYFATTKAFYVTPTGINGTEIGITTPKSGHFTTLSATDAITYGGVTLANSVTGTGSMVLGGEPGTFSGSFTSLTVVGTLTTSFTYVKIGKLVIVNVTMQATTSVAATHDLTHVDGLPYPAANNAAGSVVGASHITPYGSAAVEGSSIWLPDIAATGDKIAITCCYITT